MLPAPGELLRTQNLEVRELLEAAVRKPEEGAQ
jgi:hypothetical protein